jgi:hypothetical protein
MAHEIAQMIPLSGLAIYQAMREANHWTMAYLPNAQARTDAEPETRGRGRLFQRIAERVLTGPIGDAFEKWEQNRKIRRFASQAQRANMSAQLDADHVKGHFNDYGYPTLEDYHRRLRLYLLD